MSAVTKRDIPLLTFGALCTVLAVGMTLTTAYVAYRAGSDAGYDRGWMTRDLDFKREASERDRARDELKGRSAPAGPADHYGRHATPAI